MVDADSQGEEIQTIADEIASYLKARGPLADTVEGISRWWIMRQRLQEGQRKVELAMQLLCEKGVVSVRQLPHGEALYTSLAEQSSATEIELLREKNLPVENDPVVEHETRLEKDAVNDLKKPNNERGS